MDIYGLYRHLERRFDGEIPDHLRRVALAGSQSALETALGRANSRCCDALALSAVCVAAVRGVSVGEVGVWRREGLTWCAAEMSQSARRSAQELHSIFRRDRSEVGGRPAFLAAVIDHRPRDLVDECIEDPAG